MGKDEIVKQLRKVNRAIAEVEDRMPAHSIKPPIMQELINLEDERDRLNALLAKQDAICNAKGNDLQEETNHNER